MITIFTPTYNRAYMLPKLYESLCNQTCKDFEWLVVDDGSKDDTKSLFDEWMGNSEITIRYYQQPNGGKHRAINKGVSLAKGELFFIVDSDDYLIKDCVDLVNQYYQGIKNNDKIGGLVGMRFYPNGHRIGGDVEFDPCLCSRFVFRYKYKIHGDLAEIYKTSVIKKFPFPEIDGEKFCPEALVWVRIALDYDFIFFNKGIYICDYLPDGLTKHIDIIRIKSPLASLMTYELEYNTPKPLIEKIKSGINYWRFRFHCPEVKRPKKWIATWAMPFGWMFYRREKLKYNL